MNFHRCLRIALIVGSLVIVWALGVSSLLAADPVPPPPQAAGNQFSIMLIPDPQHYSQSFDVKMGNEDPAGTGYQYADRFDKQIQWIVDNRQKYNIRFAADVGDNVQHAGGYTSSDKYTVLDGSPHVLTLTDTRKLGEWNNAEFSLNLFHQTANRTQTPPVLTGTGNPPTQPAFLPYAIALGNHDFDQLNSTYLSTKVYQKFFGTGRFRDSNGNIRSNVASWYLGDDLGYQYKVGSTLKFTGVGNNSYQTFTAGGRTMLNLTLEDAATDEALAWAQAVLTAHPGMPTTVTTHGFIDNNGVLCNAADTGVENTGASVPNPTNSGQEIWDGLIKKNDQIFMVFCGHLSDSTGSDCHSVLTNNAGHDVHAMLGCYSGLRVDNGLGNGAGGVDKDDNGAGWMNMVFFDPDAAQATWYTYSPVIDEWATDRASSTEMYTSGPHVVEQFNLDFDARFGPVPEPASILLMGLGGAVLTWRRTSRRAA